MKRLLSLAFVLILLLNLSVLSSAVEYGSENNPSEKVSSQTFSDVPTSHWAFKYIAELVERGAINGYPDGKFYPNKIVTREEFAKIMVVAARLVAAPASASSYADVPLTYWASPFIETAKPYMTAYQSGSQFYFKPSDGALREDMAVAVVMLKGYDTRLADLSMIRTMFSDVNAISVNAQPYVALAVENGIISGYNDGTFRGQATITRCEAAAILWRAFQYGSDTKVMPGETPTPIPPTVPTVIPSTSPEVPQEEPGESPIEETSIGYVETVAKLPTKMDEYVVTKSGDIYYLKDNKLYRTSKETTDQLYDGNSDYYQEYTTAELAAWLEEEPEVCYWYGIELEKEKQNEDLNYFDGVVLSNLMYDEKTDRVFIFASTEKVYGIFQTNETIHHIYDVSDMEKPVSSWLYAHFASGDHKTSYLPSYIFCADGMVYYGAYGNDQRIEVSSGRAYNYNDYGFTNDWGVVYSYITIGTDLLRYTTQSGIYEKFNLSEGSWKRINLVDEGFYDAIGVSTLNDTFYFSTPLGLFTFEAAGTNRVKTSAPILNWSELEIRDNIPMVAPQHFYIIDEQTILFADENHQALREIHLNNPLT